MIRGIFAVAFVGALLTGAIPLGAQSRDASLSTLASYTGKDREQRLLRGARTEGKVVWYTSFTGNSYKQLARAFETQYPEIKIEVFRAANKELLTRLPLRTKRNVISRTLSKALWDS